MKQYILAPVVICLLPLFSRAQTTGSFDQVGIGTTTPVNLLHIVSAAEATSGSINTYNVNISQAGSALALGGNASYSYIQSFNSKPLQINLAGNNTLLNAAGLGNVGVGTVSPLAKVHVTGPQGTILAKFTQTNISDADGYLNIENTTMISGHFVPGIRGRSSASGRPWALSLIGEAEDITPPANEIYGGAILLDGRSKNASPLVNNNVLMVNNYGNNLVAVKANGSVGIGTTTTGTYKLAVEGTIGARKVKVTQSSWADFVFDSSYNLPALKDVDAYIKVNHHLPEMPSAEEIKETGLDVGEMNKKLLQKVEELTLYLLKIDEQNQELKKEVELLKNNINQ